jgi:hypothetical protein
MGKNRTYPTQAISDAKAARARGLSKKKTCAMLTLDAREGRQDKWNCGYPGKVVKNEDRILASNRRRSTLSLG